MSACHEPTAPGTGTSLAPLIALVGQPNCGKTTLFNSLTGSRFRTVNYPGATVEYSVGAGSPEVGLTARFLDSPGISSLNARSPDERVTVEALFNHPALGVPDLAVMVVDASQLSRHLYLARQIQDSGFRIVIALTMLDLLAEKGFGVDIAALGSEMGCAAVGVDARTTEGARLLCDTISRELGRERPAKPIPRPPADEVEVRSLYDRVEAIERAVLTSAAPSKAATWDSPDPRTLRLDKVLLHPFWGLVVFMLSMAAIFTSIFWLATPAMDAIDGAFGWLGGLIHAAIPGHWLGDFLADGLVAGIGTVVMFLPQIVILFLAMGLLEDSGYLARGAMLMDRPLSRLGLNGRSFVPMLSGFACAIPAIMAARTIPSRRERLLTILILPLMSCSARLPVYALLLGFVTPRDKPWIGGLGLTALYFMSLIAGAVVATVASKVMKAEGPTPFMLELPAYRAPQPMIVLRTTFMRAYGYLLKAGKPILVVATTLWALTYFPGGAAAGDDRIAQSYAATLGHWLDPVMQPLGFDWRIGVALIAAFAAREVFVSSLALVLKVTAEGDALQGALHQAMHTLTRADGAPLFTVATVAGLAVYFVVAMQCLSTYIVARKESGSPIVANVQLVGYNLAAYGLAFLTVTGLRAVGFP